MFEQRDLQRPWLNNSQANQQPNDPINPIYPNNNTIYCQLCSQQKQKSQMFSISQHCDHLFCLTCLCKQLEQSMKRNQDLFCPIDYCPNPLSQYSRFFTKLPNSLHNKYVIWKNSSQYMNRNQSLRASMRNSVKNSFNNKNIQKQIQKEKQVDYNYFGIRDEEYQQQQYPQIKEKKKKSKKRKQQKKKLIPQKKEQQQQKFPIVPPPPAPARIAEIPPPAPIPARQAPPIPFAQHPLPQNNNLGLPYVPYTCGRRIVKFIYIFFGLPFMFIIMLLLIINMFLIYSISILSIIGFALGIRYSIYFFIQSSSSSQAYTYTSTSYQYKLYGFLCILGSLISLIILKCFINSIRILNYLVIKNSWIWFIKQLIKIWAYPSPAPVIYFMRRLPNQQIRQEDRGDRGEGEERMDINQYLRI